MSINESSSSDSTEERTNDRIYKYEKDSEYSSNDLYIDDFKNINDSDNSPSDIEILDQSDDKIESYIEDSSSESDELSLRDDIDKGQRNIMLNIKQSNQMQIENDFQILDLDKPQNKDTKKYLEDYCDICSKKGHCSAYCIRDGPVCNLCGKEGHLSKFCPDLVCNYCFCKNHVTKKCPNKSKFTKESCNRCGQRGHSNELCSDIWRQYKHCTNLVKSEAKPVIKHISSQSKQRVYCANCGKNGHFTDKCDKTRMVNKFLGPSPIMEIINFDSFDVYKNLSIGYTVTQTKQSLSNKIEYIPEFMDNMNISVINQTFIENPGAGKRFFEGINSIKFPDEESNSNWLKPTNEINDRPRIFNDKKKALELFKLVESLPPLNIELLKKIFPEETKKYVEVPYSVRRKLRKQLKTMLYNGYLPQDPEITQDRMECWLNEVSVGKSISEKTRKNLLGSVCGVLYGISNCLIEIESQSEEPCMSGNDVIDVEEENYPKDESIDDMLIDENISDCVMQEIEDAENTDFERYILTGLLSTEQSDVNKIILEHKETFNEVCEANIKQDNKQKLNGDVKGKIIKNRDINVNYYKNLRKQEKITKNLKNQLGNLNGENKATEKKKKKNKPLNEQVNSTVQNRETNANSVKKKKKVIKNSNNNNSLKEQNVSTQQNGEINTKKKKRVRQISRNAIKEQVLIYQQDGVQKKKSKRRSNSLQRQYFIKKKISMNN